MKFDVDIDPDFGPPSDLAHAFFEDMGIENINDLHPE